MQRHPVQLVHNARQTCQLPQLLLRQHGGILVHRRQGLSRFGSLHHQTGHLTVYRMLKRRMSRHDPVDRAEYRAVWLIDGLGRNLSPPHGLSPLPGGHGNRLPCESNRQQHPLHLRQIRNRQRNGRLLLLRQMDTARISEHVGDHSFPYISACQRPVPII